MRDVDENEEISALAEARRAAVGLARFPERLPSTLAEAYRMQDRLSALWAAKIVGWKVGRITGAAAFGEDRFVGPIFAGSIQYPAEHGSVPFPVIAGGSGAVEAELVAIADADIDPARTDWTAGSVVEAGTRFAVGIEVAGSPVARLPDLGSLASIAAFGNNMGAIIGPEIAAADRYAIDDVQCALTISGIIMGKGRAGDLAGGPRVALAFALNRLAASGKPLRAGQVVMLGAMTGIHPVRPGQACVADFGRFGSIACNVVEASPRHD